MSATSNKLDGNSFSPTKARYSSTALRSIVIFSVPCPMTIAFSFFQTGDPIPIAIFNVYVV